MLFDKVRQGSLRQGHALTEQELLEARNKMVVECEEARAESPEYWLAALEHLQSRLAPRRASQLETVAEGLGALSLCDVNAAKWRAGDRAGI